MVYHDLSSFIIIISMILIYKAPAIGTMAPLANKNCHHRKCRKTWFAPPLCVSTSGQRKFAPPPPYEMLSTPLLICNLRGRRNVRIVGHVPLRSSFLSRIKDKDQPSWFLDHCMSFGIFTRFMSPSGIIVYPGLFPEIHNYSLLLIYQSLELEMRHSTIFFTFKSSVLIR